MRYDETSSTYSMKALYKVSITSFPTTNFLFQENIKFLYKIFKMSYKCEKISGTSDWTENRILVF